MNYFLRATRDLPYAETMLGEWTVRYYGQKPGSHGATGRPVALPEKQAMWLGRRLAKEWRCQVAALHMENDKEVMVACWRYDPESDLVETVQEWGAVPAGV